MDDHPYPGARACPVCWETPTHGRFTATFNRVTHRSEACGKFCLMMGIGSWNIDAVADKLGPAVDQFREVMEAAPHATRAIDVDGFLGRIW